MSILQKRMLRTLMIGRRGHVARLHPEAPEKIIEFFFKFFEFSPETLIGAYWPIRTELDVKPLLQTLISKGFRCALPCIIPRGLQFRLWSPSTELVEGKLNTLEPLPSSQPVTPEILLVPLLAFDKKGHRLGYGQGHYDHYLADHKVLTIGVGFKEQEVDSIAFEPHDISLDYVLTEEGITSYS
jgi:5-formyltetrahydrofolate cyclo-ligase